jgi:hypothetical protein
MVSLLSFDLDFSPCYLFRGLFLGLQGLFHIHSIGTQDALSSSHLDGRHWAWDEESAFALDLEFLRVYDIYNLGNPYAVPLWGQRFWRLFDVGFVVYLDP